ncbi:MAG: cation:proton antiporter subunit C [Gemmatimonadota bacterium]
MEYLAARGPYVAFAFIAALGLYLMVSHRNLLRAVIGLYLFQTSAIIFFISISYRSDGNVPIVEGELVLHNPLPHAMMLTAIVVGVATMGVALAILRRVQAESGSIEEKERDGGGGS